MTISVRFDDQLGDLRVETVGFPVQVCKDDGAVDLAGGLCGRGKEGNREDKEGKGKNRTDIDSRIRQTSTVG